MTDSIVTLLKFMCHKVIGINIKSLFHGTSALGRSALVVAGPSRHARSALVMFIVRLNVSDNKQTLRNQSLRISITYVNIVIRRFSISLVHSDY